MENIVGFFSTHFLEFQHIGLNAITMSFAATTFFALYGAWGLVKQINRVKREGADSVSVLWTITFLAMFTTCLPYGIVNGKFAMVITFICRIPLYLFLIPVIYKARNGFTGKEWAWCITITVIALCAFINVNWTFLALAWIGAGMAIDQPYRIWSTGRVDGVSIELLFAYLASVTFWVIYGMATSDWYILAWGGSYFTIYTITVILYYKYRQPHSV